MPNTKNIQLVKSLTEKLSKAKSVVFTDYKGLTSNLSTELRKKLAEENSEIEIAKNTILKISMKEAGHEIKDYDKTFEGQTAAIISYTDAFAPLKKLYEFIKTATLPTVKLGLFDGKFYSSDEVAQLSKLPSKNELIAKVLAGFNSPISGFVNVLSGTKKNFVYVLSAVAKSKGGVN